MASTNFTPMQTFEVNVISIILSLLLARILYVFFDWIGLITVEIVDEDKRRGYHKSNCSLVGAILSSLACLFAFILIYEYYAGAHGLRQEKPFHHHQNNGGNAV